MTQNRRGSGAPKKARWTRAQKLEAKRAAARRPGNTRPRRDRDHAWEPRGAARGDARRSADGPDGDRTTQRQPRRSFDGDRTAQRQPRRSFDGDDRAGERAPRDRRDRDERHGGRWGDRDEHRAGRSDDRAGRDRADRGERRAGRRDDRAGGRDRAERSRRPPRADEAGPSAYGEQHPVDRVEHTAAAEGAGFADLGVPAVLTDRLARDGITRPFAIQAAAIPDALAGRDVLGRGRTGSGKTLSFGLPLLTRLAAGGRARAHQPRAIVLVPTRELAMQVSDALQPLVHVIGLRHKLVAGGMPYEPQLSALERGVDLLIATPGRLMDLIDRGAADLSRVEITVLDEADHMAQMGFLEDITQILDLIPAGGQRLLFSATLDRGIDTIVERYLADPVEHSTDAGTASITTMEHFPLLIEPRDKKAVTANVASRDGRTIVFVRTKLGADRVAGELREKGVLAAALHGGLGQGQRNRVLAAFKDGRVPVLVATDVAARGIHVDDVGLVLQVDPPADHKDYLHRAGRTARAGEAGVVVTLALPHQRKTMRRLLDEAGVDIALVPARPGDEVLQATGGRRPDKAPVSESDLRAALAPARRDRERYRPGGRSRGGHDPRRGTHRRHDGGRMPGRQAGRRPHD